MLLFVGKSMDPYPGKTPQLLPMNLGQANLTYSTVVMWLKGSGCILDGGFAGFWLSV